MNIKQHKFVTEYLRDGNAMVAYWRAYNVKDPNGRAAESAANRLLRHPEIKAAIDESQSRIRNEVEREVAARRVEEVFSIEEKRVLLKKIATGQMMVEQYYKGKDCNMCTQYVRPSIWHVLSAIKEDSRLAGHYPTQQKTTINRNELIETNEKDINEEITDKTEHMNSESPRNLSRPRREGDRGITCEQQPAEARSLSPLNETQISQQNTTTDKTEHTNNESPLQGDRGTTRDEHSQQLSEAVSLRHLERHESSQQKTTIEPSPRPGDLGVNLAPEPNTITHDELMKLLYPNRHNVKQHY